MLDHISQHLCRSQTSRFDQAMEFNLWFDSIAVIADGPKKYKTSRHQIECHDMSDGKMKITEVRLALMMREEENDDGNGLLQE